MEKLNLDEEKLIELYNSGLGCTEISKIFNCWPATIRRRLIKNGIKLRDTSFYTRKYTVNEDYFNIIDTQDKAYWLGFLYADGNVCKVYNSYRVTLAVTDKEVIENFIKSLNANYIIHTRKFKDWKNLYLVTITSNKLCNDLIKWGCVPNKSLILTFPEKLPKHLRRHFIRGYFDGDGSVSIYKTGEKRRSGSIYTRQRCGVSLYGTIELLTFIKNIVNFGSVCVDRRGNPNYGSWGGKGNNCVKKFYHYLYYKSNIYLERKYNKFKEYFKEDVHRL